MMPQFLLKIYTQTHTHTTHTLTIYSLKHPHTPTLNLYFHEKGEFFCIYQILLFGVMLKIKVEGQRKFFKKQHFCIPRQSILTEEAEMFFILIHFFSPNPYPKYLNCLFWSKLLLGESLHAQTFSSIFL